MHKRLLINDSNYITKIRPHQALLMRSPAPEFILEVDQISGKEQGGRIVRSNVIFYLIIISWNFEFRYLHLLGWLKAPLMCFMS